MSPCFSTANVVQKDLPTNAFNYNNSISIRKTPANDYSHSTIHYIYIGEFYEFTSDFTFSLTFGLPPPYKA